MFFQSSEKENSGFKAKFLDDRLVDKGHQEGMESVTWDQEKGHWGSMSQEYFWQMERGQGFPGYLAVTIVNKLSVGGSGVLVELIN
jgi:hypothetical protein